MTMLAVMGRTTTTNNQMILSLLVYFLSCYFPKNRRLLSIDCMRVA
jgi:hypothetical protein